MGPNPGAIMCPLSPRAYARVNVIKEIAMLKGFKDFILRGNVIDLSVAVVIGAAFSGVVTQLTKSFIEPLLKLVGGEIGRAHV